MSYKKSDADRFGEKFASLTTEERERRLMAAMQGRVVRPDEVDRLARRSFDPRQNDTIAPLNTKMETARFDDEGGAQNPQSAQRKNSTPPTLRQPVNNTTPAPIADDIMIADTLPSGTRVVHDET